jgi:hypothetical protein
VSFSYPEHIPANLVRDIDPRQLLMSAGKDEMRAAGVFGLEKLHLKWVLPDEA